MEQARDAALAPFRAAKKAATDADLYLLHVSVYIEKLGDEETGEWDLGDNGAPSRQYQRVGVQRGTWPTVKYFLKLYS